MDGGKNSRRTDAAKDNPVIQQIMLRFRPIAPKPVTAQNSGFELPAKDLQINRVKRKYVRSVMKKKKKNKANDDSCKSNWRFDLDRNTHVQLREAGTDLLTNSWISFDLPAGRNRNRKDIMNNLFSSEPDESDLVDLQSPAVVHEVKVVESWITVESVTGRCEDRRLLGYTDDEIWKNLENDSCPGFISNIYDEVQWVNPGYRSMLDLKSDDTEVAVWLLIKVDKSTVVKHLPAFSCRARIEFQSSTSDQKKRRLMMVPCDVCRMDSGGFAWWLDVKFALSLGLSG